MGTPKLRLVLHLGTPKTGTTTLQQSLRASRRRLLRRGIFFPDIELLPTAKNLWFTEYLWNNDFRRFNRNIRKIVRSARDAGSRCVVLSSERFYVRFADFSAAAKMALRELEEHFTVTVWCVFREPLAFARSYFAQILRFPPDDQWPCSASPDPLETVMDHPWFVKRLDYAGFVRQIERLYGSPVVHATRYEAGGSVDQARKLLGVDAATLRSVPDANLSPTALGIDLLLQLNRLGLKLKERQKAVSTIASLDKLMGGPDQFLQASGELKRKVCAASRESTKYLRERFGIRWD